MHAIQKTIIKSGSSNLKKMAEPINQFMKTPFFVYVLAILFILAPIGNLVITLFSMSVEQWYNPKMIWNWAFYISPKDWIWLGMVAFAGLSLLKPRKASWAIAILTLAIVAVFNVTTEINLHGLRAFSSAHMVLSMACTLSIFSILCFFRFPYLDRRDNWVGIDERITVSIPIAFTPEVEATIVNISEGGALIQYTAKKSFSAQVGNIIEFALENVTVSAKIVRTTNNGFGVKFEKLSGPKKQAIRKILKKNPKS